MLDGTRRSANPPAANPDLTRILRNWVCEGYDDGSGRRDCEAAWSEYAEQPARTTVDGRSARPIAMPMTEEAWRHWVRQIARGWFGIFSDEPVRYRLGLLAPSRDRYRLEELEAGQKRSGGSVAHQLVVAGEILGGFGLLVAGGEFLVRGAASLAAAVRVSPLVIGLTVVAFGTSAPELGVSVVSAYEGAPDLAVGNVVGSNIFNVLLILGLSALICPLKVSIQLVRLDVPLMILASGALWIFSFDGSLSRLDGALLAGTLVAYLVFSIYKSRKETPAIAADLANDIPPPPQTWKGILLQITLVVMGLAMLGLGSKWLVDGSVIVARSLGVSELIIGLTIVAIGTSLPEAVTSVVASLRGQRDIAVGNVVGSNLFNILCVLGLSSLVSPHGIPVSEDAVRFDIPVAFFVSAACFPIFFTWGVIARWEGALLLGYFVMYMALLVFAEINATWHSHLATFVLWFAIPLTGTVILYSVWQSLRQGKQTGERDNH